MSSLLNLKEAKQLFYGGNELDRVYYNGALIWDRPSEAMWRIWNETQGLAIDFTDGFYYTTTARFGTVAIKDTTTPANNYDSVPDDKLAYPGASVKYTRDMDGVLRYRPHNLYVNSATPANQSITVVSGATYAVKVTGSVSVTASGAATGTWTAGTHTFTAATGTLTLGSTSGSGAVYVRRTPSLDVDVVTGASAKITLPYEWGPVNLFANPTSPATQTITGLTVGRKYTVYCEGAGSIALSGAGNGTATAASPRTFKASSTSLVCTVSGSLSVVHVREAYGIRQESQRTNLCPVGFASWSPSDSGVITANAGVGINGISSATRVADNSAGGLRSAMFSSFAVSANTVYTFSAYLKADSGSNVAELNVLCVGGTTIEYGVVVDLATGATVARSGVGVPISVGASLDTSGFYRVWITFNSGTGNTAAVLNLYPSWNTSLSAAFDLAATGSVLATFPQVELGPTASSPIETFGSTVTRAGDQPALATSAFPLGVATTVAVEFVPIDPLSASRVLVHLDDGTSSNRFWLQTTTNPGGRAQVQVSGVTQSQIDFGTTNAGAVSRVVGVFAANDFAIAVNGALGGTDASGSMPTVNNLSIASGLGGAHLDGWVRSVLIVPRRVSNSDAPNFGA